MPIQVDGLKICSNLCCTQTNPQLIANFNKDKSTSDGLTNRCSFCNNCKTLAWRKVNKEKCAIASNAWIKNHPERVKIRKADKQLRLLYGISLKQKQELLEVQGNKCANTGCSYNFKSLSDAHVDHNHADKHIRGLLCGSCNRALGLLKEDFNRIVELANYARSHSTQ